MHCKCCWLNAQKKIQLSAVWFNKKLTFISPFIFKLNKDLTIFCVSHHVIIIWNPFLKFVTSKWTHSNVLDNVTSSILICSDLLLIKKTFKGMHFLVMLGCKLVF